MLPLLFTVDIPEDDADVAVGPRDRDPVIRAHRAHQGRWRRSVLRRPAGTPTSRMARARYPTLENYLPEMFEGRRAEDEGLNLMSAAAVQYTRDRVEVLAALGGVAEPDRLWRNLLSSQPLAFSIAGELRVHPVAAAPVLARLTGLAVVGLETLPDPTHGLAGIEAEWFPPRELHTGDRSGFDIASYLRLADGSRLLLTIEVKYVDTFSPTKLVTKRYATLLHQIGLDDAATQQIVNAGGSQFLRSVLLTDSVLRHGVRRAGGVDHAMAVVLGRAEDRAAARVVAALQRHTMPIAVGLWSHESLFAATAQESELATWAEQMQRRYLL